MIARLARIAAFTAVTLLVLALAFFAPSIAECTFAGDAGVPRADHRLPPVASSQARMTVLKTGHVTAPEVFTFACGSPFRRVAINHVAVLIEHPQGGVLFDTGLGRNVDAQVTADMPWWAKLLFRYDKDTPARDQLDAAGIAPPRYVALSHAHWDHASALTDFTEAEILIAAPEKSFINLSPRAVLPSQVSSPAIRWRNLAFEDAPYAGFPQSLDLYGDGALVLVPLYGHTPGSIGLFLTTRSGKRFLFIGDAAWRRAALEARRPKFWMLGAIVDNDAEATDAVIRRIAAVMRANPDLVVVPAHDGEAQDAMGYFPRWQD